MMVSRANIDNMFAIFSMLPYGKGKSAAKTALVSLVSLYASQEIEASKPNPHMQSEYLTDEEIGLLKQGKKLEVVKMVKARTGLFLLEAKHYVEEHGDQYLVKAGYQPCQ